MRTLKLRAMLRVLEMTAFCISSKVLSCLTPTSSLILSIIITIIIIIIIIIIIYRFSHDVVTSGVPFDVMPGEDRYSVVETL